MFFNAVKYEILQNLRNRQVIVWLLLFPLVMGVLYKFTFGSIYEKNSFSAVPAAVVEHKEDVIFHLVMDAMAEAKNLCVVMPSGDNAFYLDFPQAGPSSPLPCRRFASSRRAVAPSMSLPAHCRSATAS